MRMCGLRTYRGANAAQPPPCLVSTWQVAGCKKGSDGRSSFRSNVRCIAAVKNGQRDPLDPPVTELLLAHR